MIIIPIIFLLSIYSISIILFGNNLIILAQQDLETKKYRNMIIDLGDGVKTNAQLTIPAVGNGLFPGVLLITGSGAQDMNSSAIFISIDNATGTKIYPPTPFFQIADYLSDRGFVTLRYDKRGVGENHTIVDSNVWGNMTINDLVQDANKALSVLMKQPEVDPNRITVLGHSEGTVVTPRVAIDNPVKVKNIVLLGTVAQNISEILDYQIVRIPMIYAKQILDKNHSGLLSIQEASKDLTFQGMVSGNLSLILTQQNLQNGTISLKPEYNPNNDTYVNIETELKPALMERAKSFPFPPSTLSPSLSEISNKCISLAGCQMWWNSFIAFAPNLNTISKVPSNTSILILNGENDTQTPVEQAMLLQQKLTVVNHPDHILITYPNLGHFFYPASQWGTEFGPIQQYVLADLYSWLESHNGFTPLTTFSSSSYTSNTTKINK
ncbi:MAG TPA: alpha/beta fold hydrolase [Nitrososphaeraceae archaeon]|nr:alpha/beta fold hydrolase [Nitrososphaeraceae archaeon]